jgi:hypothetical protein
MAQIDAKNAIVNVLSPYNGGTLTAEQFLFREIRIVSKMYLEGVIPEAAILKIREDGIFQYPTERQISRITRACYKRIAALDNDDLVRVLSGGALDEAKQINLYAIMRYNRLAKEFMKGVIGGKFVSRDYAFGKGDVNAFFSNLRQQNDEVAKWSDATLAKVKQVLVKFLVEAQLLNSPSATTLNTIFIPQGLEAAIRQSGDTSVLLAFNCLR